MMRMFLRTVSLLLVAAGLAYGGSVAWNSAQLELRRVEVAGNDRVAARTIATAPGLRRGDHLLQLSTNSIERSVEEIPWVKSARAERIIPSTIRISVTERVPRLLVVAANGPHLVDDEGVVLEASDDNSGLVRVDGIPVGEVRPGERIEHAVLDHISSILDSLDPALRERVVSVEGAALDRISLRMRDGWELLYGAFEQSKEKNFATEALLEQAEREGIRIERIDVRVPSRPAMKPR